MIRPARQDDDLTPLLNGAAAGRWNRDQILVYERRGTILGLVILWDAGHPVIRVDHLLVLKGQPACVGAALIKEVLAYAKRAGAALISFSTPDVRFVDGARKRGGMVSGPQYRVSVCLT